MEWFDGEMYEDQLSIVRYGQKSKRYDFLGNAKVTLGICLTDKKLVDEGLQLLELTDEQTLLEACQSDVNRFFKE